MACWLTRIIRLLAVNKNLANDGTVNAGVRSLCYQPQWTADQHGSTSRYIYMLCQWYPAAKDLPWPPTTCWRFETYHSLESWQGPFQSLQPWSELLCESLTLKPQKVAETFLERRNDMIEKPVNLIISIVTCFTCLEEIVFSAIPPSDIDGRDSTWLSFWCWGKNLFAKSLEVKSSSFWTRRWPSQTSVNILSTAEPESLL